MNYLCVLKSSTSLQADRSDISIKPNPFKLLYTFEMHRHNWRKAASYIYFYSLHLKVEAALKDHKLRSLTLQERLNGLAASSNALQLVHPAYAWIDSPVNKTFLGTEEYPNKKARITKQGQCKSYFCKDVLLMNHHYS